MKACGLRHRALRCGSAAVTRMHGAVRLCRSTCNAGKRRRYCLSTQHDYVVVGRDSCVVMCVVYVKQRCSATAITSHMYIAMCMAVATLCFVAGCAVLLTLRCGAEWQSASSLCLRKSTMREWCVWWVGVRSGVFSRPFANT